MVKNTSVICYGWELGKRNGLGKLRGSKRGLAPEGEFMSHAAEQTGNNAFGATFRPVSYCNIEEKRHQITRVGGQLNSSTVDPNLDLGLLDWFVTETFELAFCR